MQENSELKINLVNEELKPKNIMSTSSFNETLLESGEEINFKFHSDFSLSDEW